ncbi:hypothetical protein JYQ62_26115 [Nostoc sp. UHCC 0702]|nr:hypothetical protein JYQ62_26115 [Nostoc sp. UHCC 0702]
MLVYFVDNDIIIELASYNLFWDIIGSQKDIRVLPTASDYITGNAKLRRKYKQESIKRAKRIASSCRKIDDTLIDQSEYQSLIAIEKIDAGEALIVAATRGEPNFYLLTCDKKFLKALSNSNLIHLKNRLSKRIICLEQLLINFINNSDFDKVRRRIISSDLDNQNVAEAFADGKLTKQEQALKILDECVEELRSMTGDLLIDNLPTFTQGQDSDSSIN